MRKVQSQHTEDGFPTQSFPSLLRNLATLTNNRVTLAGVTFNQLTTPTPLQQRALDLLGVSVTASPVSSQRAPAA